LLLTTCTPMLSITTGIETTYFKQVSGFALSGRAQATQLLSLSSMKTLIDWLTGDERAP